MQVALNIADETTKTGGTVSGTRMDRFFTQKSLQPLFDELSDRTILKPIKANYKSRKIVGYDARILPDICNLMLKGRREGAIKGSRQILIAKQCEILLSAFATIGITALIDEATGYQNVRAKDALQAILDKYLLKEFATWSKKFPDDFYRQMFRLKSWDIDKLNFTKRPGVVGKYTKDIVYDRLAPCILKELEERNPKDTKGNRKHKHHQFLTDDVGHPALSQHLHFMILIVAT
jgi:P63C domain